MYRLMHHVNTFLVWSTNVGTALSIILFIDSTRHMRGHHDHRDYYRFHITMDYTTDQILNITPPLFHLNRAP